MEATKINIGTLIDADRKDIWKYWTEPEHITQWNFASEDWHCPEAENDLSPGGKYRARMEAKDGSFGFDFEAVYDEVIEPQLISYTIEDGRKVLTTFSAVQGKTKVETVFDAESQNPIDMQKQGWQAILDNFKKYVESQ